MADGADWRASLTASQRFTHVEAISRYSQADAVGLENEAYKSSASLAAYEAACRSAGQERSVKDTATEGGPNYFAQQDVTDPPESPGVRIGKFHPCHYIASGVTSAVYRHHDVALKVIVETRNIEPHNPQREVQILSQMKKPVIQLLDTFRDQEGRLVMVFPYMPLTLAGLLEGLKEPLPRHTLGDIFIRVFEALKDIHARGIIHRDLKSSAVLLTGPLGDAYLSDFGTAWHPQLSALDEPADAKILDIGTGPYRAPEVLFGDKSYGPAVDMWAAGCMLAECARFPPRPLFESRAAHEDGNQLGLILSIFKTIGSPTREGWPEAQRFRTPPFDMYRTFEGKGWEEILEGVEEGWRDAIRGLVKYSGRMTAEEVLRHPAFLNDRGKGL